MRPHHITSQQATQYVTAGQQQPGAADLHGISETEVMHRLVQMNAEAQQDLQHLAATGQTEITASDATQTEKAPPSYMETIRTDPNRQVHTVQQLHDLLASDNSLHSQSLSETKKVMSEHPSVIKSSAKNIRQRFKTVQSIMSAFKTIGRLKVIQTEKKKKAPKKKSSLDKIPARELAQKIGVMYQLMITDPALWDQFDQGLADYIEMLDEEGEIYAKGREDVASLRQFNKMGTMPDLDEDIQLALIPEIATGTTHENYEAEISSDILLTTQQRIVETATTIEVLLITLENMVQVSSTIVSSHERITQASHLSEGESGTQQLDNLFAASTATLDYVSNPSVKSMLQPDDLPPLSHDIWEIENFSIFVAHNLSANLEKLSADVRQLLQDQNTLHQAAKTLAPQLGEKTALELRDALENQDIDIEHLRHSCEQLDRHLTTLLEQASGRTNFVQDLHTTLSSLRERLSLSDKPDSTIELKKKPRALKRSKLEPTRKRRRELAPLQASSPSAKPVEYIQLTQELEEGLTHMTSLGILISDPMAMYLYLMSAKALLNMGRDFLESNLEAINRKSLERSKDSLSPSQTIH